MYVPTNLSNEQLMLDIENNYLFFTRILNCQSAQYQITQSVVRILLVSYEMSLDGVSMDILIAM